MDRTTLKYTLLAIADHIFSTSSTDVLETALERFCAGDSVTLQPHCPADLDDYDTILPKIKRAFRPKSFVRKTKKATNPEHDHLIEMVQINVPITMDLTKLSAKEKMILLQNLDMPVLMTCHQPKRSNTEFSCIAKIGIQMAFLHEDQKNDPEIAPYIRLYNLETGYFLKMKKSDLQKTFFVTFPALTAPILIFKKLRQKKPP